MLWWMSSTTCGPSALPLAMWYVHTPYTRPLTLHTHTVTLHTPSHIQMIQYQLFYCMLSFGGLSYSSFIFSYHLLDLVMSFKLLRNVLKSVLNNYKQLGMTILMTCVVIYIYTVIAFNFFRKFYRQTSLKEQACDSMFRVSGCGSWWAVLRSHDILRSVHCSIVHWLSEIITACEDSCILFYSYNIYT